MTRSDLAVAMFGLVLFAAVAPLASAAPTQCPPRMYRDNDECKMCVSLDSPFRESLAGNNGRFCYFQESGPYSNKCSPINLPVKIRSADPTKVTRCINPNNKEHTIILPLSNSMLMGFKYTDYKKATLRLGGLKTRKTRLGRTAYTLKTSGATKGLAITFNDKYGFLKKRAGLSVELVGVVRNPGGGLDLCFISKPIVCPV